MNQIMAPETVAITQQQEMGIDKQDSTVAIVLAAQAEAEIKARFTMAMHRPRNLDTVRQKLLLACQRPGFAGSAIEALYGAAWFSKPAGKSRIEGFSIRFAEEAMRCMGNIDARSTVIHDDEKTRMIRVEVLDLENNISIPTTVIVDKTIERKFLRSGEIAISTRINSAGDPVYLRACTEDEVTQKQNSMISKALRNAILRLLPGDIQAECRELILSIRQQGGTDDPAAQKKKVIDSFSNIGVSVEKLIEFVGHEIDSCSSAEFDMLRNLFFAIKSGETTFHDALDDLNQMRSGETEV